MLRSEPHPALETAEELYDDAPCGYVSYRPDNGLVLRMNQTLAQWLGYRVEDWVERRRFQDLLSAPARLGHETRHMPMLRLKGAAEPLALEMLRSDGKRMPVLVTSRLKFVAGSPALIRSTVFDATAHQRYERQLIDARERAETATVEAQRARVAADTANRAKSRFLAAMNHEFRTPINIISGFAELLTEQSGTLSEAVRAEYVNEMRSAALHLAGLLQDATRFSRLDQPEGSPSLRLARLRDLAKRALQLARQSLATCEVRAVLQAGADDAEILADHAAASEALSMVLRDIARHAQPGADLRIVVRSVPGGGQIALYGSAVAQSEQILHTLDAPLDSPALLRRGLEGSGLGLAFAERVLSLSGGSLAADYFGEGGPGLVMNFASNRRTLPRP